MLIYLSRFRKFDRNQFWVLFGWILIKGRCFSHSCWSCSNQEKVICKWLDIIHIESNIISYRCAVCLFVSVHFLPTTPFITSNRRTKPLKLYSTKTYVRLCTLNRFNPLLLPPSNILYPTNTPIVMNPSLLMPILHKGFYKSTKKVFCQIPSRSKSSLFSHLQTYNIMR